MISIDAFGIHNRALLNGSRHHNSQETNCDNSIGYNRPSVNSKLLLPRLFTQSSMGHDNTEEKDQNEIKEPSLSNDQVQNQNSK